MAYFSLEGAGVKKEASLRRVAWIKRIWRAKARRIIGIRQWGNGNKDLVASALSMGKVKRGCSRQ